MAWQVECSTRDDTVSCSRQRPWLHLGWQNDEWQNDESDKTIDHGYTCAGEFVHSRQHLSSFGERNAITDQHPGIDDPGFDHVQHPLIFKGLHSVAAEDLQFVGDHTAHGDRRTGLRAQHQANLHMPASLAQ